MLMLLLLLMLLCLEEDEEGVEFESDEAEVVPPYGKEKTLMNMSQQLIAQIESEEIDRVSDLRMGDKPRRAK